MENSKFKFVREAIIRDIDIHDVRTIVGRVFDYDVEDFFYLVEDLDGDIEKWSIGYIEAHFDLIGE